jgi:hypothetical protein
VGEPTEYQRLHDRLDAEYRAHLPARPSVPAGPARTLGRPTRPGRPGPTSA